MKRTVLKIIGMVLGAVTALVGSVVVVMAVTGKFTTPRISPDRLTFDKTDSTIIYNPTNSSPLYDDYFVLNGVSNSGETVNVKTCYLSFVDGSELITLVDTKGNNLEYVAGKGYKTNCNAPVYYKINANVADSYFTGSSFGEVILKARDEKGMVSTNQNFNLKIDRKISTLQIDDESLTSQFNNNKQNISCGIGKEIPFNFVATPAHSLRPFSSNPTKEIEIYFHAGNNAPSNSGLIKVENNNLNVVINTQTNEKLSDIVRYDNETEKFVFLSSSANTYKFILAVFTTYANAEAYYQNSNNVSNTYQEKINEMLSTELTISVYNSDVSEVRFNSNLGVGLNLNKDNNYISLNSDNLSIAGNNNNLKLQMIRDGLPITDRFDEVVMKGSENNDNWSKNSIVFMDENNKKITINYDETRGYIAKSDDFDIVNEGILISSDTLQIDGRYINITVGDIKLGNRTLIEKISFNEDVEGETLTHNLTSSKGAVFLTETGETTKSYSLEKLNSGSYLDFYTIDASDKSLADFKYDVERVKINDSYLTGENKTFKITPQQEMNNLKLGILVINDNGKVNFAYTQVLVNVVPFEYNFVQDYATNPPKLSISYEELAEATEDTKYQEILGEISYSNIIESTSGSYNAYVLLTTNKDSVEVVENITFTKDSTIYYLVGYFDDNNTESKSDDTFVNNIKVKSGATTDATVYILQLKNGYNQTATDIVNTIYSNENDVSIEQEDRLTLEKVENELFTEQSIVLKLDYDFSNIEDSDISQDYAVDETHTDYLIKETGLNTGIVDTGVAFSWIIKSQDTTIKSMLKNVYDYITPAELNNKLTVNTYNNAGTLINENLTGVLQNISVNFDETLGGLKIDFAVAQAQDSKIELVFDFAGKQFKSTKFEFVDATSDGVVFGYTTNGNEFKTIELSNNTIGADSATYLEVEISYDGGYKFNYTLKDSNGVVKNLGSDYELNQTSDTNTTLGFIGTIKGKILNTQSLGYSSTNDDIFSIEGNEFVINKLGEAYLQIQAGKSPDNLTATSFIKVKVVSSNFTLTKVNNIETSSNQRELTGSEITYTYNSNPLNLSDLTLFNFTTNLQNIGHYYNETSNRHILYNIGEANAETDQNGDEIIDEKDDIELIKGGEHSSVVLVAEKTTNSWKFTRKNKTTNSLTVSFDLSSKAVQNSENLTLYFSPSIAIDRNTSWTNDVFYQGTTVLIAEIRTNKESSFENNPVFKITNQSGNDISLYVNAEVVARPNFEVELTSVGEYSFTFKQGDEIISTETITVVPNVVLDTTEPKSVVSETSYGLNDLFALKFYPTTENSDTIVYGEGQKQTYANADLAPINDYENITFSSDKGSDSLISYNETTYNYDIAKITELGQAVTETLTVSYNDSVHNIYRELGEITLTISNKYSYTLSETLIDNTFNIIASKEILNSEEVLNSFATINGLINPETATLSQVEIVSDLTNLPEGYIKTISASENETFAHISKDYDNVLAIFTFTIGGNTYTLTSSNDEDLIINFKAYKPEGKPYKAYANSNFDLLNHVFNLPNSEIVSMVINSVSDSSALDNFVAGTGLINGTNNGCSVFIKPISTESKTLKVNATITYVGGTTCTFDYDLIITNPQQIVVNYPFVSENLTTTSYFNIQDENVVNDLKNLSLINSQDQITTNFEPVSVGQTITFDYDALINTNRAEVYEITSVTSENFESIDLNDLFIKINNNYIKLMDNKFYSYNGFSYDVINDPVSESNYLTLINNLYIELDNNYIQINENTTFYTLKSSKIESVEVVGIQSNSSINLTANNYTKTNNSITFKNIAGNFSSVVILKLTSETGYVSYYFVNLFNQNYGVNFNNLEIKNNNFAVDYNNDFYNGIIDENKTNLLNTNLSFESVDTDNYYDFFQKYGVKILATSGNNSLKSYLQYFLLEASSLDGLNAENSDNYLIKNNEITSLSKLAEITNYTTIKVGIVYNNAQAGEKFFMGVATFYVKPETAPTVNSGVVSYELDVENGIYTKIITPEEATTFEIPFSLSGYTATAGFVDTPAEVQIIENTTTLQFDSYVDTVKEFVVKYTFTKTPETPEEGEETETPIVVIVKYTYQPLNIGTGNVYSVGAFTNQNTFNNRLDLEDVLPGYKKSITINAYTIDLSTGKVELDSEEQTLTPDENDNSKLKIFIYAYDENKFYNYVYDSITGKSYLEFNQTYYNYSQNVAITLNDYGSAMTKNITVNVASGYYIKNATQYNQSSPLNATINGNGYNDAVGSYVQINKTTNCYTIGDIEIYTTSGATLDFDFTGYEKYIKSCGYESTNDTEPILNKTYYKLDSGSYVAYNNLNEQLNCNPKAEGYLEYKINFNHSAKAQDILLTIKLKSGDNYYQNNSQNVSLSVYVKVPKTYESLMPIYSLSGSEHDTLASNTTINDLYTYLFGNVSSLGTDVADTNIHINNSKRFALIKSYVGGEPILDYIFDYQAMGFNDPNNINYIEFNAEGVTFENSALTMPTISDENGTMVNLYLNGANLVSNSIVYNFKVLPNGDGFNLSSSYGIYHGTNNTNNKEYTTIQVCDNGNLTQTGGWYTLCEDKTIATLKDGANDTFYISSIVLNDETLTIDQKTRVKNEDNSIIYTFTSANYKLTLTLTNDKQIKVSLFRKHDANNSNANIFSNLKYGLTIYTNHVGVNGLAPLKTNYEILFVNYQLGLKPGVENEQILGKDVINLADKFSIKTWNSNPSVADIEEQGVANLAWNNSDNNSYYYYNNTTYYLTDYTNSLFAYNDTTKKFVLNAVGQDVNVHLLFNLTIDGYKYGEIVYDFTIEPNYQIKINNNSTQNDYFETKYKMTPVNKTGSPIVYQQKLTNNTTDEPDDDGYYDQLNIRVFSYDGETEYTTLGEVNDITILNGPDYASIYHENNGDYFLQLTRDYSGIIQLRISIITSNGTYTKDWEIEVKGLVKLDYNYAAGENAILTTTGGQGYLSGSSVDIINTASDADVGLIIDTELESGITANVDYVIIDNASTIESANLFENDNVNAYTDLPVNGKKLSLSLPYVEQSSYADPVYYIVVYKITINSGLANESINYYAAYRVYNEQKLIDNNKGNIDIDTSELIDRNNNYNLNVMSFKEIITLENGQTITLFLNGNDILALVVTPEGEISEGTPIIPGGLYEYENNSFTASSIAYTINREQNEITYGSDSITITNIEKATDTNALFTANFDNINKFKEFVSGLTVKFVNVNINNENSVDIPFDDINVVEGRVCIELQSDNDSVLFNNFLTANLVLIKGEEEITRINAYSEQNTNGFRLYTNNVVNPKATFKVSDIFQTGEYDQSIKNYKIIAVGNLSYATADNAINWVSNIGVIPDNIVISETAISTITVTYGSGENEENVYNVYSVTYTLTGVANVYTISDTFYCLCSDKNLVVPDYQGSSEPFIKVTYNNNEADTTLTLDNIIVSYAMNNNTITKTPYTKGALTVAKVDNNSYGDIIDGVGTNGSEAATIASVSVSNSKLREYKIGNPNSVYYMVNYNVTYNSTTIVLRVGYILPTAWVEYESDKTALEMTFDTENDLVINLAEADTVKFLNNNEIVSLNSENLSLLTDLKEKDTSLSNINLEQGTITIPKETLETITEDTTLNYTATINGINFTFKVKLTTPSLAE